MSEFISIYSWIKAISAKFLISCASLFLTVVTIFLFLDFVNPDFIPIIGLSNIHYFGQRYRYAVDDELVMKPRDVGKSISWAFTGDLAISDMHCETGVVYHSSYNQNGFRPSITEGPYDIALFGDSFIEFGEDDNSTLSAILDHRYGVKCINFGRNWYGPEQYNVLAKMHLPKIETRIAAYCVFVGNDLRDIGEYRNWKNGGEYYNFKLDRHRWMKRMKIAVGQTIRWIHLNLFENTNSERISNNEIGICDVDGRAVPMRYAYWPRTISAESAEWDRLLDLIVEFKGLCSKHDAIPLIVLIPTKEQVYSKLIQPGSLAYSRINSMQDDDIFSFQREMMGVARSVDIQLVDFTREFVEAANRFPLIYWKYDTHWTIHGRFLAADILYNNIITHNSRNN
jgi:hypothetical protein